MTGHEGGEYQQQLRSQERTRAWLNRLDEIERIRDALGFPIDEHIREAIVALNVCGIPTSASCEGHSDRGKAAPWIKVEAPNRPHERFIGEREIIDAIAQKYHVFEEDVRAARDYEAWKEATALAAGNGETNEYHIWRKENNALQEMLATFLAEFYQGRTAEPFTHLEIELAPEGTARLHNGGNDYKRGFRGLTDDERRGLAKRLEKYQQEMIAFTEFLREKYYSSQ